MLRTRARECHSADRSRTSLIYSVACFRLAYLQDVSSLFSVHWLPGWLHQLTLHHSPIRPALAKQPGLAVSISASFISSYSCSE
ncbi:hypothetical protein T4C_14180 [Trichinella pseudospiralis]|uniref:Uncharacterized protein n=1 Tax=Trichinella pseudospiralis TaxID=6337 RepID=A0A0V1JN53_TRIPS|nr:hypothetical protein T4C_14180 [Trichinella pseudospiralis]